MKTPYEREVLFEHLDLYAKRHGMVRVELNRREWTVVKTNGVEVPMCEVCDRRLDAVTYALGGRTLCAYCAKREMK